MKKIYVNKNNVVETYMVNIDEEKFRQILADIDVWFGKGNIKKCYSCNLMTLPGKKQEILSKKAIDSEVYEYEYYEYIPCSLSRIGQSLLDNDSDVFTFSRNLRNLFSWTSFNDKEKEFLNRLTGCFSFEKVLFDEVILSDLSLDEKKNYLRRMLDALMKIKEKQYVIAAPKEYETDVFTYISKDNNYQNSTEKIMAKRRIFESLPRYDQII